MEVTYTALKQKDVINVFDGRNMGKVCDVSFTFPENCVLGYTVTGCKGFRFSKQEVFIPVKNVVKIGKDAVLVKIGDKDCPPDGKPPMPKCESSPQQSYPSTRPCPPQQNCPPPKPCPPRPGYPAQSCPPFNQPCNGYAPDRRSYDEYE